MGMNMSSSLKYAHEYGWDKRNTTEVDNTSTYIHPHTTPTGKYQERLSREPGHSSTLSIKEALPLQSFFRGNQVGILDFHHIPQ